MKTAEAILAIPAGRPERLFPGEAASVQPLYHRLAAQWHPDRSVDPSATAVFQHIAALYATARRQIAAGCWRPVCGQTLLRGSDGREHRIRHVARRIHDTGELLIGHEIAAYLLDPDAGDLYQAGIRTLRSLRHASPAMCEEIAPWLPRIEAALQTPAHHVLVIGKSADMVLLADLAEHLGGRVPAEHVAWIVSCLLNLACYLEWAQLTHNAIGPETVFVSPQRHACALLGGWWYAAPAGGRLVALPQRTVDIVPPDIVRARTASARGDLELIRATGRELLGDPSGVRLLRDPKVPRSLAEWLQLPGSGSALIDYRQWRQTLRAAFGRPRFMRLDVSFDQVYPASTTNP
jgi:hypothetical protein